MTPVCLLADPSWHRDAAALDAELARLCQPNDRLRLRFGEALAKLGMRYRDLGFRRLDLYVRERGSRSGRWGAEARRMAERLAHRPLLRSALVRGAISWSMAELVARHLERSAGGPGGASGAACASPRDLERELVSLAEASTVRQMREELGRRAPSSDEAPRDDVRASDPGAPSQDLSRADAADVEEEPRVRIRRKMPAHQALSLDLALSVIQHLAGGSKGDAVEWLLAEAQSTVLRLSDPGAKFFDEIADRYRKRAAERAAALAECENDEAAAEGGLRLSRLEEETPEAPNPLPDDPVALDAEIRQLGAQLASADHFRGWTVAQFLALKGWVLLGYASDTQYARERLGISRSEMYRLAQLARRCERLPQIRDAVRSGDLGSSMAGLVVRVATPATQETWLARAQQRTFKHLKEEVEAVERVQRYVDGVERDFSPPSSAEMVLMQGLERDVLTGRALRRALGVCRPDLDGVPAAQPAGPIREAFLRYRDAFEQATAFGVRVSVAEEVGSSEVADAWTDGGARSGSGEVRDGQADAFESVNPSSNFGPVRNSAGPAAVQTPVTSASAETEIGDSPVSATPSPDGSSAPHAARKQTKGSVWWSESVRSDVALHLHQLEEAVRFSDLPTNFLDLALDDFFHTWALALGRSNVWEHIYRNYRYRCTSPVCDSANVTLHHITYRAHGGDDHDENLTTPCDFCHLDGEHGNRLRILPPASCPTFELGSPPVLVVEGRRVVAS